MTDKLLHEIRVFLNEVAQRDMYGSYRLIAYSLLDDIFEELEAEVEKNSHTS
jgi:bifunctional DNase/RNase